MRALTKYAETLRQQSALFASPHALLLTTRVSVNAAEVKIYVRRGGPNYQEGLEKMRDLAAKLELPIEVFGPEAHMTSIVSLALNKPIKEYEPKVLASRAQLQRCFAEDACACSICPRLRRTRASRRWAAPPTRLLLPHHRFVSHPLFSVNTLIELRRRSLRAPRPPRARQPAPARATTRRRCRRPRRRTTSRRRPVPVPAARRLSPRRLRRRRLPSRRRRSHL